MPTKREIPTSLTERDSAVLRFIGEGGLASLAQLNTKFWPGRSTRSCRSRLGRLTHAGYLKCHFIDVRFPAEMVFTLTRLGAAQFKPLERAYWYTGLPARHEIKQQLVAQDVRLMLETQLATAGKSLISWQNEHQLRSAAFKAAGRRRGNLAGIGDARIVVRDSGGQLQTFEIEIDGDYFGRMLKDKLANLVQSRQQVLWVTNPARVTKIEALCAEAKADNITVVTVG